jgi:hypothetical protein
VGGAAGWLRRPEAVERSIESGRSAPDLAAALHDAATRRRTSTRVDGSPYIVRLGGTVDGRNVALEARLLRADGTPGRPKRPLVITGDVRDRPGGSLLHVRIAPDDRRTLAWVVAIPAIAVGLMLAARVPPPLVALIAALSVPNVLAAIRAGQRFPLRSVSLVEALLEAIAAKA